MNDGKLIFGLDIGSSKIVAMVGSVGEEIEIQGMSSYHFMNNVRTNDFSMVSNGVICNLNIIGAKVAQVLNEARINADCSVGSVIVNVAGNHLRSVYTHQSLDLNGSTVSESDLNSLIQKSKNIDLPATYELINYEIQEYVLDKENYTVNPLGLTAQTLESNINLFVSSLAQDSNLKKAVNFSGFNVSKLVPSGILSGMAVLNREEKELGCCLLDIGAGTTDVVVYENGFIRHLISIPVGGENITRDIASVLKLSRNLAEDIKLSYGSCNYTNAVKNGDSIALTDHRGNNSIISRRLLTDVIRERIKDIFNVVKLQLNQAQLYDIINSGIIITGGTALLANIKELAEQSFNHTIKIGIPNYSGNLADLITNPKYATCVGSLSFVNQFLMNEDLQNSFQSTDRRMFGSLSKKLKDLFKN